MREITTHKVNGLNDELAIIVRDDPSHGGACHHYEVGGQLILFQMGPIKEHGVNGLSNEALLAVVRDRLACFQAGPYACQPNADALASVIEAMEHLHSRTRERMARGVEGTHKK